MESKHDSMTTQGDSDPIRRTADGAKTKLIIALICLGVVATGVLVAYLFIASAPEAPKRAPAKLAPLVRVQEVFPQSQTIVINAMGTVVPARELTLKSRVAGQVVSLHPEFTQGGIVRKGEQIVLIEEVDYRLIVAQKQSAVADASYQLKLELARQGVARREWTLYEGNNPTPEADAEMALRKPHLEKARSDLAAAEAELEAAKLQLARTRIVAPFNAIIRSTHIERGSQVAVQEVLATLAGMDQYWVKVSVPVDRLQWIAVSDNHTQPGAQAQITYQGGAVRSGRVEKLLSDLEAQGRMARLLITVQDPLNTNVPTRSRPAMLIGEYVRVAIQGRQIESAYRIPRQALRDDIQVWVADKDSKLSIRKVEAVWRDTRTVVLKEGLQPGDQVIVSDLATPVAGMAIQVENNNPGPSKPASVAPQTPEQG